MLLMWKGKLLMIMSRILIIRAHTYSIGCFTNLKNSMAQVDNVILNQKENACNKKMTMCCDYD